MEYTLSMEAITQPRTITQAIEELCWKWLDEKCQRFFPNSPAGINSGLCDEFANIIEIEAGFGKAVWGDKLPKGDWSSDVQRLEGWFTTFAPHHCFIVYEGRYYDSECPEGCEYPDELPHYQRQIDFILEGN